jgi:hypothetical protein
MKIDNVGEKDGYQLGTEAWQSVFLSSFKQLTDSQIDELLAIVETKRLALEGGTEEDR